MPEEVGPMQKAMQEGMQQGPSVIPSSGDQRLDPDCYSRSERDELRRNLQITLEQAEKRRAILNEEIMAADATLAACRQGIAAIDELTAKDPTMTAA